MPQFLFRTQSKLITVKLPAAVTFYTVVFTHTRTRTSIPAEMTAAIKTNKPDNSVLHSPASAAKWQSDWII